MWVERARSIISVLLSRPVISIHSTWRTLSEMTPSLSSSASLNSRCLLLLASYNEIEVGLGFFYIWRTLNLLQFFRVTDNSTINSPYPIKSTGNWIWWSSETTTSPQYQVASFTTWLTGLTWLFDLLIGYPINWSCCVSNDNFTTSNVILGHKSESKLLNSNTQF